MIGRLVVVIFLLNQNVLSFQTGSLSFHIVHELNKEKKKKSRVKATSFSPTAITYTFSGGRLGDNLLSYMHAKWVAYKNNIPLLYKPFRYAEKLVIHRKEIRYSDEWQCRQTAVFQGRENRTFDASGSTLHIIPYFPESPIEQQSGCYSYFPVNWEDPGFKKELQKMIAPLEPLDLISIPPDKVSIAVHVRRFDNGFDSPAIADEEKVTPIETIDKNGHSFKFIPDSFYIEKIREISEMLNHPPLFVFIFTDGVNPPAIVEKYKAALLADNIEFGCRPHSCHTDNVLEDFFSMARFDYLIRSLSNFPVAVEKIGNFKAVFAPY